MAGPPVTDLETDYIQRVFPEHGEADDVDSEDDLEQQLGGITNGPLDPALDQPSTSRDQVNGSAGIRPRGSPIRESPRRKQEADRFGFYGGKQFTNPEKYAYLNV